MKRLIVVDVSNFIFRAFFAIRPLHAADGTPVNAVYGVLSSMYNLITKYYPTHIVIARDTKEGSYRKEIYPEYKANRTEPPDELIPQFALIENLVDLLKLPSIRMPGYEADDIIGSVATQFKDQFDEILIASGDKDLMQFVGGPVKMLDTMKEKTYSREDVLEKMGVYPEQIVDYLSLVGDTSDNIPGVPGIGAKGASNLLAEFQNLETILANKDKIKNKKTQNALIENEDKAHLSKSLVKITTDLKLPINHEEMVYSLVATNDLISFLEKMNFKSWLTKLKDFHTDDDGLPDSVSSKNKKEVKDLEIVSLDTVAGLKKNLKKETTAIRAEWSNPEDQLSEIKSLMFYQGEKVYSIFFPSNEIKASDFFKVLEEVSPIVVSNDMKSLLQTAILSGHSFTNYFDISQAHFLINPERKNDIETLI
jgi:DNA polymerase-1